MLEILDVGEYRNSRENLSVLSHAPHEAQQALNWGRVTALGERSVLHLTEENVESKKSKRSIIPFMHPVMYPLLSFPKKSVFLSCSFCRFYTSHLNQQACFAQINVCLRL